MGLYVPTFIRVHAAVGERCFLSSASSSTCTSAPGTAEAHEQAARRQRPHPESRTLLGPQSQLGNNLPHIRVVCPHNGTAVRTTNKWVNTILQVPSLVFFRRSEWSTRHGITFHWLTLVVPSPHPHIFSVRFSFSFVASFDFSLFSTHAHIQECVCRACRIQCDDVCVFLTVTLLGLQSRFGNKWGQITWNLGGLSPKSQKRDCSSQRFKPNSLPDDIQHNY